MAKHPVPKKKKAKSETRTRYTAFANKARKKLSDATVLTKCGQCGSVRRVHFACETCGSYRGRKVIDFEKKDTKGITKIKA